MPGSSRRAQLASERDDEINLKSIDEKLNVILTQLSSINKWLDNLESNHVELGKSMNFMHNESEELKAKIVKMQSFIQDYEKKLESFKNLDSRIEAYDHCSRAQCIELNGIEFTEGEDLSEAFHRILKHQKIDSISATHDIDKIYRIKRSKRVIIKLVQTSKRDQFFNIYRKNIMDTSMIGFKDKSVRITIICWQPSADIGAFFILRAFSIPLMQKNPIILGDFNIDYMDDGLSMDYKNLIASYNFTNVINIATSLSTRSLKWTCLDHTLANFHCAIINMWHSNN